MEPLFKLSQKNHEKRNMEPKYRQGKQKTNRNMADLNSTASVITKKMQFKHINEKAEAIESYKNKD